MKQNRKKEVTSGAVTPTKTYAAQRELKTLESKPMATLSKYLLTGYVNT
jgi:hypothetical protein